MHCKIIGEMRDEINYICAMFDWWEIRIGFLLLGKLLVNH